MKLGDIYSFVIDMGRAHDPRPKEVIEKRLVSIKKEYDKLDDIEKEVYDEHMLANPYADTRILNGDTDLEVQSIMVGIDIETPELILADRLCEKGRKIDLVMAHHPEGRAFAGLSQVMTMQADIYNNAGVPINVAEGIMEPRMDEVRRAVMPGNLERPIDTARLLELPFMCCHSPADNMVQHFLTNLLEEKKPDTIGEVMELLMAIPEYKEYAKRKSEPSIFVGDKSNSAGKIIVDMTGGTGTSENMYEALSAAGVGTIIGMHMSDKSKDKAEKYHINVVIAGHLASDSLGMNLILDKLEASGIEIIPMSGLIRVRR